MSDGNERRKDDYYVHYLRSKISVDDRALNRDVLAALTAHLTRRPPRVPSTHVLRVLEIGAGIGAMLERFMRLDTLSLSSFSSVEYVLVDVKPHVIAAAFHSLSRLCDSHDHSSTHPHDRVVVPVCESSRSIRDAPHDYASQRGIHHRGIETTDMHFPSLNITPRVKCVFHVGDAISYARKHQASFDVLIASAVLDLWELSTTLPCLLATLRQPLACYYFPLNFDGVTDFFPPSAMGPSFDTQVQQLFHDAMGLRDTPIPSDRPPPPSCVQTPAAHTGRRLIPTLAAHCHAMPDAMGASAWIVAPRHGKYPDQEKLFLDCIVDFIESSVPAQHADAVDVVSEDWRCNFQRCIASRRRQIEETCLIYVAHNLDVFGTLPYNLFPS